VFVSRSRKIIRSLDPFLSRIPRLILGIFYCLFSKIHVRKKTITEGFVIKPKELEYS
jgi:hypothetical protein